jgi:serine/threonine-protein kinase
LKVIEPIFADLGSEPERMFKRELQLRRRVTHQNVIHIHDFGEFKGTKFISMPLIEGSDLAMVLRARRTLPVAEAIRFAKQIAAGLRAEHEVGVVHRDLKPGNILISADTAIIIDFGLAYTLSTGPGRIVGTPRYLSPEQLEGFPADERSDVYAFGLILYEMLQGEPFKTWDRLASAVVRDFERQEWPNGLNRVLSRCLAVDPLKRYRSATMLADDLGALDENGFLERHTSTILGSWWCWWRR